LQDHTLRNFEVLRKGKEREKEKRREKERDNAREKARKTRSERDYFADAAGQEGLILGVMVCA